jgi:hypothetical protein
MSKMEITSIFRGGKMKMLAVLVVLSLTAQVYASPVVSNADEEIGDIVVTEIFTEEAGLKSLHTEEPRPIDIERVGKIISIGKDIVALGEAVYDIVKKGKPTNTTTYVAISVVPKDPTTKEVVSPFELEGFSTPTVRNFSASVKTTTGREVVKFDYQVLYSYGGSYNGKGKYLTGVMIVPKSIETSWAWEFNATMKLDAIMNHGSKDEPVAGALVTIKYQVNGWTKSVERNDSIHLTGNGELKSFGPQ